MKKISEFQFKVVIPDIRMSRMHGFELLDKIHEMDPDITRIVLSGHADMEFVLRLVNEKGVDRYLVKPCESKDLILSIKKCIELYDLRIDVKNIRKITSCRPSPATRNSSDHNILKPQALP